MNKQERKTKIIDFMNKHSYLDLDIDEEVFSYNHILAYRTRDNGNVGDEEYGDEDYEHSLKIKSELISALSECFDSIEIQMVDEWVHMDILIKE